MGMVENIDIVVTMIRKVEKDTGRFSFVHLSLVFDASMKKKLLNIIYEQSANVVCSQNDFRVIIK